MRAYLLFQRCATAALALGETKFGINAGICQLPQGNSIDRLYYQEEGPSNLCNTTDTSATAVYLLHNKGRYDIYDLK